MLNNVPKILSPELLKTLCEMGHSDVIVLGDGNFPGDRFAHEGNCKFLRCDGHGVPELLDAILTMIPLDAYVEHPVHLIHVAFFIMALHADLVAVGLSDGARLIRPLVPDMAVQIMDIIGLFLINPQNLIHAALKPGPS